MKTAKPRTKADLTLVTRTGLCSCLVLVLTLAMSTSCRSNDGAKYASDETQTRATPTIEELGSATYHGLEGIDHPVTLVDGRWEGEPFVPGAASRPTVHLVRGSRLTGDVDGDGSDEAVVLLGHNSGGSGEYVYLSVVRRTDEELENIDTTLIGDRVQIRGARIDGNHGVMLFDASAPDGE
jgi:hypothetical protein